MIITKRDSARFYLKTGEVFSMVPCKSRPGEMRKATIADAREAGACPSVTTILGVVHKPALEVYKVTQGVMSALTLPRHDDEPVDVFALRVIDDMTEQSEKAKERGSQVHEACAEFVKAWDETLQSHWLDPNKPIDLIGDHVSTAILPFCKWVTEHITRVHAVEEVFVGDGYAGRVDLIADVDGRITVCDLKTQTVKKGKPAFWSDWVLQLAAYRKAEEYTNGKEIDEHSREFVPRAQLMSIVIDTNPDSLQPGAVYPHVWPEVTFDDDVYYEVFQAAYKLWAFMNNW